MKGRTEDRYEESIIDVLQQLITDQGMGDLEEN
jgi:hypothetical protein